jgi:hypothetical protein
VPALSWGNQREDHCGGEDQVDSQYAEQLEGQMPK